MVGARRLVGEAGRPVAMAGAPPGLTSLAWPFFQHKLRERRVFKLLRNQHAQVSETRRREGKHVAVRLVLAPLLHHDEKEPRSQSASIARPAPPPWRLTPARCVRTGFSQTQHTLPVSVSARIAQTAAVEQTSGAERPAVPWGLPSPGGARDQRAGRGSVSSVVHHAVGLACARIAWLVSRIAANLPQPRGLASSQQETIDGFALTHTLP